MRQQKAIVRHLVVSVGLALALPACAAAAANRVQTAAAYSDLADLAASATLLDAWRDYALASLRPDFSWASGANEPIHAPSLFERGRARLLPPASHFNGSLIDSSPFHVAVSSTRVSDTPFYAPASGENLLPNHAPGLQRYVVAPSISQPLGNVGAISVSAIFAYQHFGGITAIEPAFASAVPVAGSPVVLRSSDTASGTGLRVDYVGALTQRLSWQLGVQSRINMDPLGGYRGLYAEPGTFDIPSSANVGLGVALTPALRLDAGVERVMYNQVAPFTSKALPAPLLADLSSSRSPEFAWQNLDVYSLVASWHGAGFGEWSFRYSTREQPVPTSALLRSALPAPSAHNYELAFAHGFGRSSTFQLSASYAPTDFVLGLPLSYTVSNGGNQMQWEALWITSF
jgi:hypothetical protein